MLFTSENVWFTLIDGVDVVYLEIDGDDNFIRIIREI